MKPPELNEALILETLRRVVDPEIDCNIVDLGLIYGTRIEGGKVSVQMTLTTQGCPMHESIAWGVKNALLNLEGVIEVEVEIVWDPPWHPSMMSDYGRECVGMGA
jgi:metal-sulfur cluster biosynthetic enzyme